MKVISAVGKAKWDFKNPVLAIGVFDGVHQGHRFLIEQTIKKARAIGGTSIVMTFFPHPVHVLHSEMKLSYVVSLQHRLKLIEDLGIDVCIVIRFTKQFSKLTPQKFINHYLVKKIKPKEVFVGEDFRFGQNRSGNLDLFKTLGDELGFKVNIVSPVELEGETISSSRIRKYIGSGQLDLAVKLLGRRVSVLGKVERGASRGKTIGYPTANIHVANEVIPPGGVYIVEVVVGEKKYRGMANIGYQPTFNENHSKIHLEVHVFDFKKNIYGKEIVVEFIKKIRDEKKFSSSQALLSQIKKDEKTARTFFASH